MSPVYLRGHGQSVFACASTLVQRGEYRAQTGIWRWLVFVSVRTIKGRSILATRKRPVRKTTPGLGPRDPRENESSGRFGAPSELPGAARGPPDLRKHNSVRIGPPVLL